jgi:hypothetical protein
MIKFHSASIAPIAVLCKFLDMTFAFITIELVFIFIKGETMGDILGIKGKKVNFIPDTHFVIN